MWNSLCSQEPIHILWIYCISLCIGVNGVGTHEFRNAAAMFRKHTLQIYTETATIGAVHICSVVQCLRMVVRYNKWMVRRPLTPLMAAAPGCTLLIHIGRTVVQAHCIHGIAWYRNRVYTCGHIVHIHTNIVCMQAKQAQLPCAYLQTHTNIPLLSGRLFIVIRTLWRRRRRQRHGHADCAQR